MSRVRNVTGLSRAASSTARYNVYCSVVRGKFGATMNCSSVRNSPMPAAPVSAIWGRSTLKPALSNSVIAGSSDAGGVVDLANRGNAERARHDRDVRMRAALFQNQAAQPLAVVIEQ